ncbi:ABC transporter permease [Allopontixanthobacter sp.]|uniref:ABC transporter permease n=1 Tax=Allopontixanthobacter sp. TaxID=2906452 RepID=UPI002AB9EB35|nr:ABC transporter permease [Allopontixanthobacter sp.]MDZ4308081.1 hypothetical protein [Allopontixanthobacter sp.]
MTAFAHLVQNDVRTLYRTGYVWVSIAVFALMLLIAMQASNLDFAGYEQFVAAIILFDAALSPVMLVGLMVLLERSEGAFAALSVSPMPTWAYLAARVLVVSLFSLAQMLLLVLAVYDASYSPTALTAGLAGAACISGLFGFLLVSFFDDLYAFLLPMIGAIMLLGVPGYAVLLGIPQKWLFWHPTSGPMALIEKAFALDARQGLFTAVATTLVWAAVAAILAHLAIGRMQARIGGS